MLWKCLLFFFIPLSIATTIKIRGVHVRFYDMFWYLSIFVAMMCAAWFMLVKKMDFVYNRMSTLHRYIVMISDCCFGIYLVHIFVMRSLLWRWAIIQDLNGIVQIGTVTVLSFVGSLLITWLISYIPRAEYIIGFKQSKK